MKKFSFLLLLLLTGIGSSSAQGAQYTPKDSATVMSLLASARKQPASANALLFFARQLKGIPYVAQTLERNQEEELVVNLRQLDCTTYVENVLALYLCHKNRQYSFQDFCSFLRQIRYKNGNIAYTKRLHYFTQWIEDNTQMGFVKERQAPRPPFTQTQTIQINYMSSFPAKYPMLANRKAWIKEIKAEEDAFNGRKYLFIPKGSIKNTRLLRQTIHDGDIIAIVTRKSGLDTSHIGIAVWHRDGLHMLNASQIHKKVVEEPMTLYTYMQKHPSQIGIRIIKVCE